MATGGAGALSDAGAAYHRRMASLAWLSWRHRVAGGAKRWWARVVGDELLRIEADEEVRLGRLERRLARTLRRKR